MPELIGSVDGESAAATLEYAVADGVTVTTGDFVYLSGGRVTNAAIAGKELLGLVVSGDTEDLDRSYSDTAVGDSDGNVKVLVHIDPEARYLIENDNAVTTFAETHVGTYFDLTGGTGAQQVDTDTTSATTGQLFCLDYNPGIRGTGSAYGVFKINEHQLT